LRLTVTTGGVESATRTMNVALDMLPCASVARQVTRVFPTGKSDPEGGTQKTGSVTSTRSVAFGGGQVTIAPVGPVGETVMLAGMLWMVGGVVSTTVTVKVAEDGAAVPMTR